LEKIVWLSSAKKDLINIYNYISNDSLYYAMKTINNIIEKTEMLDVFPYTGRKMLDFPSEGYRELIYKSYKIIYKINSSTIYIHRVWHSARLVNNLFSK